LKTLEELLDGNWEWAARMRLADPGFLTRLAERQKPSFLWIGCADSRVPVNEILAVPPGSVFVHRNIANIAGDESGSQAVIQYAVEMLEVKHIVVCGHYGCGGVKAALEGGVTGHLAKWIEPIVSLREKHRQEIDAVADGDRRQDLLCELNVREQVDRVCATGSVRSAWKQGRSLEVHGLVYRIAEGTLEDLGVSRGSGGDEER